MRPVDLTNGDCLEFMANMPDGFADCIVTDPPYGDTALAWDVLDPRWIGAAHRCLAPNGTAWVFGSMRMFLAVARKFEEAGFEYRQDIVWQKQNGSGFQPGKFQRVHEIAIQFRKRGAADGGLFRADVRFGDQPRRQSTRKRQPPHRGDTGGTGAAVATGYVPQTVIFKRNCNGFAVHPTQKPVNLIRTLIEASCPPGGVVFDPFTGSGTTGVAARAAGRRFVGCELDRGYYLAAWDRLLNEDPGPFLASRPAGREQSPVIVQ